MEHIIHYELRIHVLHAQEAITDQMTISTLIEHMEDAVLIHMAQVL